jgi:hypothetical protein
VAISNEDFEAACEMAKNVTDALTAKEFGELSFS